MERGLYVDPEVTEDEGSEELRRKLDSWIAISTLHKGVLCFFSSGILYSGNLMI